jgi:putative FmdB family regulatory protein
MPAYTYYCPKCNKDITVNRKMSAYTPTIICQDCLEEITRKIEDLLPQNYIVNCSGFYGKGQ